MRHAVRLSCAADGEGWYVSRDGGATALGPRGRARSRTRPVRAGTCRPAGTAARSPLMSAGMDRAAEQAPVGLRRRRAPGAEVMPQGCGVAEPGPPGDCVDRGVGLLEIGRA